MEDIRSDWENAGSAHLQTYRGVMKAASWCTVGLAILLILMAIFLV